MELIGTEHKVKHLENTSAPGNMLQERGNWNPELSQYEKGTSA